MMKVKTNPSSQEQVKKRILLFVAIGQAAIDGMILASKAKNPTRIT